MGRCALETADKLFVHWKQFRYLPAAVLAVAAIAKASSVAQILSSDGPLALPGLLYTVITIEVAAAVFIATADAHKSWLATVGVFLTFLPFAAYAVATDKPCHCFGTVVSLDPRIMLGVDSAVVVLAFLFRPKHQAGEDQSSERQSSGVAIRAAMIVGFLVSGAGFAWHHHQIESHAGDFLLADMLISKPWPSNLTSHPDLEALETGQWLVLIVRADCDHCRQVTTTFFADPKRTLPDHRTVVFLADGSDWPFELDRVSLKPLGSREIRWPGDPPFVASPVALLLRKGIVHSAADGLEAEQFLTRLFDGG